MADTTGIQLPVDIQALASNIKKAISEINSKGLLKDKGLNLSVNTNKLATNIKKAISEINAQNKLKNKPLNLSASESKLRQSISAAITNINRSKALSGKPINIDAKLNVGNIKRQIKSQIAELNSNPGKTNLGTVINDPAVQSAVVQVRKELQEEGEQLKNNNNYLRERNTLFAQTGVVKTSTKYGSLGKNTTINTTDGNLTSITSTVDNTRIAAEQAKATAAINETRNAAERLRNTYADINKNKSLVNTKYFDELENRYNEIIRLTDEFEKSDSKNTAQFKVNMENKRAELERFIKLYQTAQYPPTSLAPKDVNTLKKISTNQLDEFVTKVKSSNVPIPQMQATIDNLYKSLSNITNAGTFSKFYNEFAVAKSEFSKFNTESKATTGELSQLDTVTKQITNSLATLALKTHQGIFLKNNSNEYVIDLQKRFADLTAKFMGLQSSLKNDNLAENVKKVKAEITTLQQEFQKAISDANVLKTALNGLKAVDSLQVKGNVLAGQITEYMRQNDLAMGVTNTISGLTYGAEMEQIRAAIPDAHDLSTLDQLNNKFVTLRASIKTIGKEGTSVLTEMKGKLVKFIKWYGMTMLVMKVRQYFSQLFTTVLDLDTELTDLRKTFRGSTEDLNAFYFEANKLAKQMGVTTAEIIKTGSAWSRLGYSSNETMKKMAEMSSMFAAISPDMNTEQATDGLVSIMKAFDIAPNDVLDEILSKVNIIGNTAATSNGEIVEMLKKSSAAMRLANNSLAETVALETAAVEVSRDPSSVGVAFKTISARLRALDEETLETTGDIEVLAGKFAEATKTANNPGGISLFTDSTKQTYKSTYQIFKELSEIWDDLTDRQTAVLGELLGGKRQLQVVSATIENFDAAEKAMANMADSVGNAEAEMDVVRQGIAYALNELKETFAELAQDSVSRDFLKNLIKTGTGLLTVLDNLVKVFGALPVAIGASAAAITAFKHKGKGLFDYNAKGNLTFWGADTSGGFKSWLSEKTDPTGGKAQIKSQVQAVKEFDTAIKTNNMSLQTYNAVMRSSNDNVKRYGRAVMQGADSTQAFKAVNKQLKTELNQVGKNAQVAADGTKKLSAGMKALNIAGSMLVSMGISLTISKVIELISTSINWANTYSEKADEAKEKTKSIESQITSVNEELSTTKLRIDELSKIENPTIIEQEELDKLIATNDELERLLKSLKAQAKDTANQAADATVEWWKTIYYAGVGEGYKNPWDWAIHWMPRTYGGMKSDIKNESYDDFLGAITEYKDLQDEIAEKQKELSEATDKSYIVKLSEQIEKLQEEQKEAQSIAEHNYSIWTAKIGNLNLDIPEQKEIYDKMSELIYYWEYFTGRVKQDLAEIVDDPSFAVVKQKLIELWQQGKLTEEEFAKLTEESVSGIEEFKKALEDNGYTNFAEVLRAISKYFKDTGTNADNAAVAVKDFSDMLDEAHKSVDDFISRQEKLVDAFKKLELGGKLTTKEIYELSKEIPNILKYLKDDLTISSSGLLNASKDNIEEEKEKIKKNIEELSKATEALGMAKSLKFQIEASYDDPALDEEYQKALEKARQYYEAAGIMTDDQLDEGFSNLAEKAADLQLQLELLDKVFNEQDVALDGLKERYADVKSEISDYNKEIQTINDAIKTLNDETNLSYEELNALLDINPDLQYDSLENGYYSVAIDALEEMRQASYETRNALIEDTKARALEEINAANETIENYKQRLKELAEIGASTTALEEIGKITESITGLNAQTDYLYDLIKKLNGLEQDITYEVDKKDEKSLSDKLQEQIDQYKTIIDAVKTVRDKYSDAIGNEIDALEESKDALKDANDERQREIDLREAIINLENAKKRKAWVYSEGNGFQQVQDEGAVKEAAEKYCDAVTDVQEAEIDKKIEILKKQQEDWNKDTDKWSNIEQDISDAQNIQQALKILGLTNEKDLATLPESTLNEITDKLADVMVQKENEDNKDNSQYKPVTLDDVLKSMGVTVTSAEVMKNFPIQDVQSSAATSFANNLKNEADNAVKNIINNNTGNSINSTFNINGVNDPEEIAKIVNREITNLFTQLNNSIK